MEDKIRLLSQQVTNRIAAGEVVTHPASVIKEMMENSIDAGATEVTVNYRQAGYELIQIVDNGAGMSSNDARMAFERHATSKISSEEDVYRICTFGFRGEALASIAAVAKVELKSCVAGREMGTVTTIENGNFVSQHPERCEQGSNFMVREIFQDTPARRRFMDKETKSALQLNREFRRVALCYPDVAFELYGDGAPLFRLAPTTLLSRIVDVVGRSAKTSLLELKIDSSIVKIHGYIGNERSLRKRNSDQYMFANGRYFESKSFVSAILKGYDNIIKMSHQPSFFLYFEVKPQDLDVNIHPQKTQVNFVEESAVWKILYAAVRRTLAQTGVVSMMSFDDSSDIEIPVIERGKSYSEPRAISNEHYNPFEIEAQQEARHPKDELEAEASYEFDEFESSHTPQRSDRGDRGDRSNRGGNVSSGRGRAGSIGAMRNLENIDTGWESGFESGGESGGEGYEDVAADSLPKWEPINVDSESSDDEIIVEYENYESTIDSVGEPLGEPSRELNEPQSSWRSVAEDEPKMATELPIFEQNNIGSAQGLMGEVTVTNGRYGWCKIGGNMSVVDLKRAKERILYDHYCSTIKSAQAVSQRTFFPQTEQLTTAEYMMLRENIEEFHRAGFQLNLLDGDMVEIVGVPAGLRDDAARELIEEILQTLSTPEDLEESRRERIAMVMSQNGAKGIGKNVSPQQAGELVAQLMKLKEGGRTADGRKIIWNITSEDIKRRLK